MSNPGLEQLKVNDLQAPVRYQYKPFGRGVVEVFLQGTAFTLQRQAF